MLLTPENIDTSNYQAALNNFFVEFLIIGMLFAIPVIIFNTKTTYLLTPKKNKDVLVRRITFLVTIIIIAVVVIVPKGLFSFSLDIIDTKITEESEFIMSVFRDAFHKTWLIALSGYIFTYVIVAFILTLGGKNYKPMTVFKSNNKFFGII